MADCKAPFVFRNNTKDVISALEKLWEKLLTWFSDNEMKTNADKCHLLLNPQENNVVKIGNFNKKSLSDKLVGVNFVSALK